jgi:DNA-binding MarR family transcriptional regulator
MTQARPSDAVEPATALAEELRGVLHRLLRQLRHEGDDMGISRLHLLLLATLREHPGIGIGDLARLEKLRGPTISGHVKSLEALGLVERAAPDPRDRRRVGLVLTAKGSDVITAFKRSRTDWLARRLAGLSPAAREAIRDAIGPLNEIVQ